MILNDLKPQDRFRFSKESRQKLGLEQNDVFAIWVKYGVPGSPRGILVRNLRTGQKIEVPADFEVIPEKESRVGKALTTKKELELLRRAETESLWRSPLSAILLAFIAMLVMYLGIFLIYFAR